jgi:hypothetical protein
MARRRFGTSPWSRSLSTESLEMYLLNRQKALQICHASVCQLEKPWMYCASADMVVCVPPVSGHRLNVLQGLQVNSSWMDGSRRLEKSGPPFVLENSILGVWAALVLLRMTTLLHSRA